MGLDVHNLALLAHASDRGARFERVLTLGRQGLFAAPWELEAHRALRRLAPLADAGASSAEPLLRAWFGAREIDAVDASPYEGANLVHDLNQPWPDDHPALGRYDAVLDLGCLEHVFDFPTAWRNAVRACRPGGHLLHALPANNLAGHGFYQFSPELFANLYRPARGFERLGLYLARKGERRWWWQVADPLALGRRVTLAGRGETYLLVIARKLVEAPTLAAPQQSDYAQQAWRSPPSTPQGQPAQAGSGAAGRARRLVVEALVRMHAIDAARALRSRLARDGLHGPDYERIAVERLLRPRRA